MLLYGLDLSLIYKFIHISLFNQYDGDFKEISNKIFVIDLVF